MKMTAPIIRENPWDYRQYIPAHVYRDLITKVAFLGSESTGKSTMADICSRTFNTKMAPEYGADYWHKHNVDGILSIDDLDIIAEKQLLLENELAIEADRYLFCDTTPLTTYVFSKYYHGRVSHSLEERAKMNEESYDVIFVCDTDIPFDGSNGRRSREVNLEQQKVLIEELKTRKIRYTVLRGTVEERLNTVKKVLSGYGHL